MRYWYLDIQIVCGEYEFHSRSTQKTKKEEFDAEAYVADFYGFAEGKDDPDSDYYYFNCGQIACRVYNLKEITRKDYDILTKYLW